jgi:hypothetical protein
MDSMKSNILSAKRRAHPLLATRIIIESKRSTSIICVGYFVLPAQVPHNRFLIKKRFYSAPGAARSAVTRRNQGIPVGKGSMHPVV